MALLSCLIFLPVLGIIGIMFIRHDQHKLIRIVATSVTGLELLLILVVLSQFNITQGSMQFVEKAMWIPQLNVHYHLGIDGISLVMLVTTGLLTFLACVASFNFIVYAHTFFFALLTLTSLTG